MSGQPRAKYRRILLKISGEHLKGRHDFGIDPQVVKQLAGEIRALVELGVQTGIVIGGGNIFRGAEALNMNRSAGDYIGMIATMINALTFQAALEDIGVATRVMSAIEMREVAEPYIRRRAVRHLERGLVVIFGCGTGNPYFTTDTAAALRANETASDILLKATQVDGVYSADPKLDKNAKKLDHLTYHDLVSKNLRIMDTSAVSLCRDNQMPILVFNLNKPGNILKAVMGEKVGTFVDSGGDSADV
ncbi:UMP kinase [Candidatus Sumerlaeota bacterium]|nr:UMP kinase [Candidatus Sumerlaeota bacterium]